MTDTVDTAVIGGSGLYSLSGADIRPTLLETPYAQAPVPLFMESLEGKTVCFLPRHGADHGIPPHKIPFRAQLWALREVGVSRVLAVNAVGGINPGNPPGQLVIPDQVIDYTWGREHSYFDGLSDLGDHIDFTDPYTQGLRDLLIAACARQGYAHSAQGVYACTQGPRLETRAEIRKYQADGCDVIGMTGMPEAALARELGMEYASLALVVNWAAGLRTETVTIEDIQHHLQQGLARVRTVLLDVIPRL